MADRHTAAFWAGGAAFIAGGGIFMAVTGFEPTKTPGTVWANSWFDLGFAFVILGLIVTGIGVVLHFRREVQPGSAPPAVNTAASPPAAIPPAVNPAEWKAHCGESGEFPDSKTLTLGLDHVFNHRGAFLAFGAIRCTVTDPDGITTNATGPGRYFQYPQQFENARPVRPGLYRFRFEGQLTNGEWVDITSSESVVKPPLTIEIVDNRFENWRRIALIAALRVKVTNTTGAKIRLSGIGFTYDPEGSPGLATTLSRDERLELDRVLHDRRERQHYGIPLSNYAMVPAGESITGWVVETVTPRAEGGTPACTVVIKDELGNEYRAMLSKREPQVYGS